MFLSHSGFPSTERDCSKPAIARRSGGNETVRRPADCCRQNGFRPMVARQIRRDTQAYSIAGHGPPPRNGQGTSVLQHQTVGTPVPADASKRFLFAGMTEARIGHVPRRNAIPLSQRPKNDPHRPACLDHCVIPISQSQKNFGLVGNQELDLPPAVLVREFSFAASE